MLRANGGNTVDALQDIRQMPQRILNILRRLIRSLVNAPNDAT